METFLKISELVHGRIYGLRSRNLKFGVWVEDLQSFIGIKHKFNSQFLASERHWDADGVHGTAKPVQDFNLEVPEEIKLNFDSLSLFYFLHNFENKNSYNDIVVGLGFGDEGKGTIVDFLASQRKTEYVVRFSGGSQAAHNVVTTDGREHTFAQFGSATFRGVKTILSRYMMVNVFNLVNEADHLSELGVKDPLDLLSISGEALLTTPFHQFANQRREMLRGNAKHGSCGLGIGETMSYKLKFPNDAVKVKDLLNVVELKNKLTKLDEYLRSDLGGFGDMDVPTVDSVVHDYESFMEDIKLNIVDDDWISCELKKGYNIFEGSQGVLLDQDYGFHPHTTWSDVTPRNAQRLLTLAGLQLGRVIGVTRSYTTRHGAGPFPSEFSGTEWVTGYPEKHNAEGVFQGGWRAGLLDLPLLRYATNIPSFNVDCLAVTHLDIPVREVISNYGTELNVQLSSEVTHVQHLENQQKLTNLLLTDDFVDSGVITEVTNVDELLTVIEDNVGIPVWIESYGPTSDDKRIKS